MEMADVITAVTQLVTAATEWIGQYIAVVTENSLLLMFVIVSFVGLGVGLINRLIRL